MLPGLVIGTVIAVVRLSQAFRKRHEPEPANNRWKLPLLILMTAACVVFTVAGLSPVVWAALAMVLLIEIGFVLAGRNPWWMQGPLDHRARDRRRERSTSAE